jgi:hypothetical protein
MKFSYANELSGDVIPNLLQDQIFYHTSTFDIHYSLFDILNTFKSFSIH